MWTLTIVCFASQLCAAYPPLEHPFYTTRTGCVTAGVDAARELHAMLGLDFAVKCDPPSPSQWTPKVL
jgi:hypothetical protein